MSQVNVVISESGKNVKMAVKVIGNPSEDQVVISNENIQVGRSRYQKGSAIKKEGNLWKFQVRPVRNDNYTRGGNRWRRNSGSKTVNVRPDKNSNSDKAKRVRTQELDGGIRVLSENVRFNNKVYRIGTKLGIDGKGYFILNTNTKNVNATKRKEQLLKFITKTEYYNSKQKIIDAINMLEGNGITYLRSVKELLLSNPEESLNKKFTNPKKAVMGVDLKKRTDVKKQIEKITRLVYINRLFKRLKQYLFYLKKYDDALVKICCEMNVN